MIGYRFFFDGFNRVEEDVYPDFGKFSHALCYFNTGPPHTFLFLTEDVVRRGGFDTGPLVKGGHEDYEFLCRLAADGCEAVAIHSIGCVYRQTAQQMSRQFGNMRISRVGVWLKYANQLLGQDVPLEQLVHLLCGYVCRIESKDVRYEANSVFARIAKLIVRRDNEISRKLAILIGDCLTRLLRGLPSPQTSDEQEERKRCIEIAEALARKTVQARLNTHDDLEAIRSLADLADAHIWAGEKRRGRALLTNADHEPPQSLAVRIALKVLTILSMLLPGRLASTLWRSLRCSYKNYFVR